jgi:hypothetical protein
LKPTFESTCSHAKAKWKLISGGQRHTQILDNTITAMESNNQPASTESPEPTYPSWGDPILHEVFHRTKPQVEAWCMARPDVSSLASLEGIYSELRLIDAEREHLWARPTDSDHDPNEVTAGNASENHRPWWGILGRKPEDQDPWEFEKAFDLEGLQWYNAVLDLFDARVRALRSRAMHLSRDGVRPLKITDLPWDILRCIFECFRDEALESDDRVVCWDDYEYVGPEPPRYEQRRALKSARLACRLFCDLASPHLLPIVELELSQSSLEMLDEISRAPGIAAGVRGVKFWLAYRSKDLANDIRLFRDARLEQLEGTEVCLDGDLRDQLRCQERGRAEQHRRLRLEEAIGNMSRLRREWTSYPELPEGETPSEYQRLLLRGHKEFRRMHEEQRLLLEDGFYARSIASAIARMGNVRSFRLVPWQRDNYEEEFFRGRARRRMLKDTEMLIRYLASPFSWTETEGVREEPPELACVKLVWELPIALHRAGASLTELSMDALQLSRNAPMLCPRFPDAPEHAAWDELSAACEQLEIFEVEGTRMECPDTPYDPFPKEAKFYVDKYLASVLARCGDRLRWLHLDLKYSWYHPLGYTGYYAGPVIGALQGFSRAHVLVLEGVQLRQAELEALFDMLGHGDLTELRLSYIRLQNGSWADAVDILRQKLALAETNAPGELDVSVGRLLGGEFGNDDFDDDWRDERESDVERMRMIEETERYVKGQREDNPLKEREVQARLMNLWLSG